MDITSRQTKQQCVIFFYKRILLLTNILLQRVVRGPGMYEWIMCVCVYMQPVHAFKCIMQIRTVFYLINNWQKWGIHIRNQSDPIQKCTESLNTHFWQQHLHTVRQDIHVCPYFSITYRCVLAHGFPSSHKLFSRGRSCRYKIWFSSLILFLRT